MCNAWVGLLERPHWGRAWILQEVALAREIRVACGEDVLSWAQIKQLWMLAFICEHNRAIRKQALQSGAKLTNGGQDLQPLNLVIDSEPQSFTIESVLENFRLAKCSDIRDHIYAFISLVNWNLYGCRPLGPNYGQSAFRLVMQLAELIPIDQFSGPLSTFNISHENTELRQLVDSRQNDAVQSSGCANARWMLQSDNLCEIHPISKLED
jgi:hypothetical protein